ncbi:uncharacterized protein LOC143018720 [Oratosquilla oratoria]|uniref:uncharacterized protein LOC143018720 n=1 Tax=Oratosquilla oratoria TaxID=337810 RepID=UPI003F76B8BE
MSSGPGRVVPSGRKNDPVWNYFEKLPTTSGKGYRAKCKDCSQELQGIVSRLKSHRDKCQGQPQHTEEIDDPGSVSTASIPSSSAPLELSAYLTPPLKRSLSDSSTGATSAKSFSSKRKSSTSLDRFIIKTSPSQKENSTKKLQE